MPDEIKFYKEDEEFTVDLDTLELEMLLQGNFWKECGDGMAVKDAKGEHLGVLKPCYPDDEKVQFLKDYVKKTFPDQEYDGKWEYIVMVPNYWGKAKTMYQAVQNCLDQCKTQNHRLNLGKGSIRAFLGQDMYTTEYGGIGGYNMKELPELEVRTDWGEGLVDLVSTDLNSLQEFINQFKVDVRGVDRVFTELEESLTEAIREEFPENYDIPSTLPPKPRLKVPDYIKECDTEKLKTWYLNAKATCACGGRRKGERNDQLVALYTQELNDRGEEIPEGEGQFNGEGSS